MIKNIKFQKAWKDLTIPQTQAASWGEGPFLLLAGPGSGKTRVLTCRVARILSESEGKNFRVLALTFTNKAADEMRGRIIDYCPDAEGRAFLGTFHSFCADILRQHGSHVNIQPDFKIYSNDSDLQAVFADAVLEASKGNDNISIDVDSKMLPVVRRLKSNLIFSRDLERTIKDKEHLEKLKVIYPAYEDELRRRNALDFDSLILYSYKLLVEFPALAKRLRTVFPYICVDEFQDTNYTQYMFVKALAGSDFKNLFIVADDDQVIYQWNGASYRRLEDFVKEFNPTVLQLPVNHRCPSGVVEIANKLIQNNYSRMAGKTLTQAAKDATNLQEVRLLNNFSDGDAEARGIVADILSRHGNEKGNVVVLARNRKLLDCIAAVLRDLNIDFVFTQRKDEFQSHPFVWLHSALRLAVDPRDQRLLEILCSSFMSITDVHVSSEDVISQAEASRLSYLSAWVKYSKKVATEGIAAALVQMVSRHLIEKGDFELFSKNVLGVFDSVANDLSQTDYTSENFASYSEEKMAWQDLVREISLSLGENLNLESFLQELQMRSKEALPKKNSIQLSTIHSAKGREFENVYLIGLVEDELPSFQSVKKGADSQEMEEERRNCFVAITRTIKELTLSYASNYRGWNKRPSRFLREMGLIT